jgi:uncharacterized damage-inducible protein DinB
MSLKVIPKPGKGEYPAYADIYMNPLPADGNVLQQMKDNFHLIKQLIFSLPEEKLLYRYAPEKWTIKEVLVHIIDDERIYAYRALRFARNDKTELPGFEQDDYTLASGANERSLENIFEEYGAVRLSTIAMFNSFSEEALLRKGIANNNMATVRALAWHIAGHEVHHLNIIKQYYL